MSQQIKDFDSWDGYPRISSDEFAARFPLAHPGPRRSDYFNGDNLPPFFVNDAPFELLIVSGSLRVHGEQLAALASGTRTLLVVDGDLHVDGVATGIYYVSGDVHCHAIFLEEWLNHAVGGRVVARDCAFAHVTSPPRYGGERIDAAPALTLDTPLLFVFCVDVTPLVLVRQTLILGQGRKEERTMFIVESRFQIRVKNPVVDQPCCDAGRIIAALRTGQPVIVDGHDPEAERYIAEGYRQYFRNEHRAACVNFKKATIIAPGYYRAWQLLGNTLDRVGAYRQALPALVTASRLFPRAQTSMRNEAADEGARCALRCGEFATALELATVSIEHNRPSRRYPERYKDAYLLRAEARLLADGALGVGAALDDLDYALANASTSGVARWLKGLAYWHAGESALAAHWHALAVERDGRCAHSYDEGGGTAFLGPRARTVDWDSVCVDDYVLPESNQAYWDDFMRGAAPDWMQIRYVPEQFRTSAMCEAQLEWCDRIDAFVKGVPPHAFTRKIAEKAAQSRLPVFRFIPPRFIDKALCLMAVPLPYLRFPLDRVPAHVIDRDVYEHALRCGASLAHVPAAYLDRDMGVHAITQAGRSVQDLPVAMRDDDMILLAIAHGEPRRGSFPRADYLTSPAYLMLAVERHKSALDAIPGYLFTEALYETACRLYGADADWPQIVARRNGTDMQAHWRASYSEVCWSVFWTEATLLRMIAGEMRGIPVCDVPAERFSAAVARACALAAPAQLSSIPARWIDAAICDIVSLREPNQIAFMPLALRSAAICARAMKADPANFGLVPLARRSLTLCVAALRANPQRTEQIPLRRRRQVFDTLIDKYASEFDIDWLHRERARSAGAPAEAPGSDMLPVSALLDAAQRLASHEDHERALERLRSAADLLTGAGCQRADLWAELLNLQRKALLGLGRAGQSAQACRDVIERFGELALFRDGAEGNPVREALRECYLAEASVGDDATLADLEAALTLLDKGLAVTPGPREWPSVHAPLQEARAATLKRLAAMAPSWQGAYEAALAVLDDDRATEQLSD